MKISKKIFEKIKLLFGNKDSRVPFKNKPEAIHYIGDEIKREYRVKKIHECEEKIDFKGYIDKLRKGISEGG